MTHRHPEGELRVSLVQMDTVWHDPATNRHRIAAAVAGLETDLIVLPETFTTGFSNEAIRTAEDMTGETVRWLRALARSTGAAVTGSVQVREASGVYNRLLFGTPSGELHHYDKRHLFRMAGEHERYAAGSVRLVVEWLGWRICPLVCYDLRFPVFSRNRVVGSDGTPLRPDAVEEGPARLDYDLLLYVANWPRARHEAWRTLLRARAIENLAYVAGVNRVGTDGNGHAYRGGSVVVGPLGETVVELGDASIVSTVVLERGRLDEHRERFPAWRDADDFSLDGL
jgi:omega-amidase